LCVCGSLQAQQAEVRQPRQAPRHRLAPRGSQGVSTAALPSPAQPIRRASTNPKRASHQSARAAASARVRVCALPNLPREPCLQPSLSPALDLSMSRAYAPPACPMAPHRVYPPPLVFAIRPKATPALSPLIKPILTRHHHPMRPKPSPINPHRVDPPSLATTIQPDHSHPSAQPTASHLQCKTEAMTTKLCAGSAGRSRGPCRPATHPR